MAAFRKAPVAPNISAERFLQCDTVGMAFLLESAIQGAVLPQHVLPDEAVDGVVIWFEGSRQAVGEAGVTLTRLSRRFRDLLQGYRIAYGLSDAKPLPSGGYAFRTGFFLVPALSLLLIAGASLTPFFLDRCLSGGAETYAG